MSPVGHLLGVVDYPIGQLRGLLSITGQGSVQVRILNGRRNRPGRILRLADDQIDPRIAVPSALSDILKRLGSEMGIVGDHLSAPGRLMGFSDTDFEPEILFFVPSEECLCLPNSEPLNVQVGPLNAGGSARGETSI